MDNPWANAWLPQSESSSQQDDNQETDIGLPSWSTTVQWNEPSTAGNSLWAQPTTDATEDGWEPSTYEGIPISKSTVLDQPSPPHPPSPKEEEPVPNLPPLPDEQPPVSLPIPDVIIDDHQSPPPTPKLSNLSPPASPNAFGSFESADADADADTSWTDNVPTAPLVAGEWGSAWAGPPAPEEKTRDEPEDEWEIAKRKKEEQDRHVVCIRVYLTIHRSY
jgi:hypothetical protein